MRRAAAVPAHHRPAAPRGGVRSDGVVGRMGAYARPQQERPAAQPDGAALHAARRLRRHQRVVPLARVATRQWSRDGRAAQPRGAAPRRHTRQALADGRLVDRPPHPHRGMHRLRRRQGVQGALHADDELVPHTRAQLHARPSVVPRADGGEGRARDGGHSLDVAEAAGDAGGGRLARGPLLPLARRSRVGLQAVGRAARHPRSGARAGAGQGRPPRQRGFRHVGRHVAGRVP
mmetsp:Transcript_28933/g.67840  ORF Transcript_28933/g.67840 Transcript_28933/m.67840 type:complete len:233 (+) Transcript_28933:274-972(+)